jgi:hypothetical protein
MKRSWLVLATLLVLGLTYGTLTHLGWFKPHVQAATPHAEASAQQDPLTSAAGARWRNSEVHHWRGYMMKQ